MVVRTNGDDLSRFTCVPFSVIKRLISLLASCAREMADSAAARKQAEGAHRHLEGLMSTDGKVVYATSMERKRSSVAFQKLDPKDIAATTSGRFIDPKEHDAEIEKYKQGLCRRRAIEDRGCALFPFRRSTQSTRRYRHAT